MKFVLANWGTRGEVEPYTALGRELLRRGHDVTMAVGPELVGFAESTGAVAVPYGPSVDAVVRPHHDFWTLLFSAPWRRRRLNEAFRAFSEPLTQHRAQVCEVLLDLAAGADLLVTGLNYEDVAFNVAEACGTPLATMQLFPIRVSGHQIPVLPAPLCRASMATIEWVTWRGHRVADRNERRQLGLPPAAGHWAGRTSTLDVLELQAYDPACYPGLPEEWAQWNGGALPRRPFVGSLSMEMPTEQDGDVLPWIAAGTPPVFFGFGSMPIEALGEAVATIARACARLGERALIGAGWADTSGLPEFDHVKVVGPINYAEIFPHCRAVVHHGGAGTVHAGLRAGCPSLLLWMLPDQACWSFRLRKLGVGTGRRFVATTEDSLVHDLRVVLSPEYRDRARRLATRMTAPSDGVARAADLVERFAAVRRSRPNAGAGRTRLRPGNHGRQTGPG
ncbi:glycosyltransferase [uncultured Mycolicibacterium sp.]|uniref:glycosyltransferase n=1 Tax=uncultured Mycolicibacterium sp. TaxID=2320817 RepID=UPI002612AD4F|nr:glycosyltransferase [uncultured Mycolicibacterium sp.]